MDELLEQFVIEARELVAQAAQDFVTLAQAPGDAAAIDSAFRAIHTLKGSFAVFGLPPAESLLHAAEDVLDRARRQREIAGGTVVAALVSCLDQTDRWIDAMAQNGALPPDAAVASQRCQALLLPGETAPPPPATPVPASEAPDWLASLCAREATVLSNATTPLVAFRYAPDADCFFRAEDPLAVVQTVPELVACAVLPAGGAWPTIDEIEPFSCFSVVEGLSAAPETEVRAAFRLQRDQVEIALVAVRRDEPAASEIQTETGLLRVEAARVDRLAEGLGDLIVAVNRLTPLFAALDATDRAMAGRLRVAQTEIERATTRIRSDIARVRLVPLAPALRRLPRLAREIADSLGKQIDFTLTGDTIEVDKQIADGLFEPLLHLLRNAIDHGIETPDVRRAAGKPAAGTIALTFQRDGDTLRATLADDGAGIDAARVRRTAIARGLIAPDLALDEAATMRLIFLPGFSTAARVTGLSGRGVGMDAVQAAISRLRGGIEIDSRPGAGTRFRIGLPANALTTRLLVVTAGGERYGLSLGQVVETARIDAATIRALGTGRACVLRDRTLPVLDLATLLDATPVESPHARLVVTEVDGQPVAIRVDGFLERIDTVLRPPRGLLATARGVIGSALMGDGSVLLVLDLPELAA